MKTVAKLFLVLALTAPVLANASESRTGEGKDLCLLASIGCSPCFDSITDKINKLEREIQKGTSVYSSKELRVLQHQLNDYEEYKYNLEYSGGGA